MGSVLALTLLALVILTAAPAAWACDALISRAITQAVQPAIEGVGCPWADKAGYDRSHHTLERVCYEGNDHGSQVELAARFVCATSEHAVFPGSLSEWVQVRAEVRAKDCAVVRVEVAASGALGQLLLKQFDAEGQAGKALQRELRKFCG